MTGNAAATEGGSPTLPWSMVRGRFGPKHGPGPLRGPLGFANSIHGSSRAALTGEPWSLFAPVWRAESPLGAPAPRILIRREVRGPQPPAGGRSSSGPRMRLAEVVWLDATRISPRFSGILDGRPVRDGWVSACLRISAIPGRSSLPLAKPLMSRSWSGVPARNHPFLNSGRRHNVSIKHLLDF